LSLAFLALVTTALAVPANGKVWTFKQPDGTPFQAVLQGDEFYAYHKTPAGEIILQDANSGVWYYAKPQPDGSLTRTTQAVGKSTPQTLSLNKDLVPWLAAVQKAADEKAETLLENFRAGEQVPPTGSVKGVMLLANFSDTSVTHNQATFTSLMNTVGYNSNGALGSVRDYYYEASYGQLTLTMDVYGWFTLPNTWAYYGANTAGPGTDIRPAQMITDAITASDSTVNYANYDADSDGWVDFFGVIHQGQGEEQSGASTNCIWSHRSSLASYVTADTKKIQDYHTEPELYYTSLTTIGVICHESGHFFGLPDLYDTDYSSYGVGNWSVMAAGTWCGPSGNGAKPCHFDPWCKIALRWMTPTVVTSSLSGASLPAFDQSSTAYLIPVDPYQDGEFFLVCNRYARATGAADTGFDQYIPGSGALILHVDEYIAHNDTESHKKVDVEEADGLAQLDSYSTGNAGDSGDVYSSGSFNDSSNPNAKDYANANTGIVVTGFTGAGTASMTCNITPPTTLSGECILYDDMGAISWIPSWGYNDGGDDYGMVRFTTDSRGGILKRVTVYFNYTGTTNYEVNVYSGLSGGLPTGLLTAQTGSNAGAGYREITLSSPQTIAANTDFYVEVRYNTGGGNGWPCPVSKDTQCDSRSYIRSNSSSAYYQFTPANAGVDMLIRADVTPPVVVTGITRATASPTNLASVNFYVTFNTTVSVVSTTNFSLNTTGLAGASVTGVSGSGSSYTVTASTGTGDGTIRLDMANSTGVTDTYGQAVSNVPYTSGETYTVDKTLPQVVSSNRQSPAGTLTNASQVTWRVTFSEDIDDTSIQITDFVPTVVSGSITGESVANENRTNATTYDVTVNTGTGDGVLRLDVPSASSILDLAGNDTGVDFNSGQTYTIDKTLPTFTNRNVVPGIAGLGQTITITFDASETLAANPTVTVNSNTASFSSVVGLSYTYSYLVTGSDSNGPAFVTFDGTDLAGNTGGILDNTLLNIDITPPTVTITSPTSNPTYTTDVTPLTTLAGTASDTGGGGLVSVSWSNDRGGSGSATGISSWSVPSITLQTGDNVITVTATDGGGNTGTDVLTVTYSLAPAAPTSPGVANLTTSTLTWTWADNSSNETGFKVYWGAGATAPGTVTTTTAADVTQLPVSGLTQNTQYAFQVAATNTNGDSAKTSNIAIYTHCSPPAVGVTVAADKSVGASYPAGTTFTFSNPAGFGTGGATMISAFNYAWDTSATYSFGGLEPVWNTGTLPYTPAGAGSYYLHLMALNGDGANNPVTLDYGPFVVTPGTGVPDWMLF